MLARLLSAQNSPAAIPEGATVFAIGDIHGRLDLLDALLSRIESEDRPGAILIFLGDYVDRGPDTLGVIDRLLRVQSERASAIFLKGNHEAGLLDFLADPDAFDGWLDWGGRETLASYGVERPAARRAHELAEDFRRRLPATHLAFLSALSLCANVGDYHFVHAGVRPGVPLDAQDPSDQLWIRSEFHNMPAALRPDKVIVHGHQPTRRPIDAGWRIGVDTGAVYWGSLTAVMLDGARRRFISVQR